MVLATFIFEFAFYEELLDDQELILSIFLFDANFTLFIFLPNFNFIFSSPLIYQLKNTQDFCFLIIFFYKDLNNSCKLVNFV